MKYVKVLSLLAVAAAAFMAFAATASATTVVTHTKAGGTHDTPTLHAETEGHAILHNTGGFTIECASTVEGTVTSHGSGVTAAGHISTLNFTNCTNNWHVTVVTPGTLEIHYVSPGVGTVTSSGATVSTTRLGIVCNYATNNTDVGTFTDATKASNGLGTLDIAASIPPHSGSSALCGAGNASWTGSYALTESLTLEP